MAAAQRPASAQSGYSASVTATPDGKFECTASGYLPNWGYQWYWAVYVDDQPVAAGPGGISPGDPYGPVVHGGTNPFSVDYFTGVYTGTHKCEFFAWEYGSYPGTAELWDDTLTTTF
jgi:hypothetical protein